MTRVREADRTPSLNETVRSVIQQVLADVHVCLPAEVVSYNSSNQTASVQPQLKRGYDENGSITLVNLPVIPNVPVCHPRANEAWIHLPVKAGDNVLLIVAERSLDNWKSQGGIVNPASRRKFNLTDAFAIPGGYSPATPFSPKNGDDLEIRNDQNVMSITPSGEVSITSQGELLLGADSLTEFVAIASRVEARLSAIETALAAHVLVFNTHVHVPTLPPTVPDAPFVPDSSVVASTKVKLST